MFEGLSREQLRAFLALPEADKREVIWTLDWRMRERWLDHFGFFGEVGQFSPGEGQWRTWLMLAGRGYGKTRAGAEWVNQMAMLRGKRIALVAASIDEARAVMVEGKSGILAVARRRGIAVEWEPSLKRLRWGSGSEAALFSGEHGDGLRGPEHHFAWCDELAKWGDAEGAWDNLQMGLRLGPWPRALVTTTPRPMRLLERIKAAPGTVTTGGATGMNVNLPERFVEEMNAAYGGTRIGRQELEGELLGEAEGSLFPRDLLERGRCTPLTLPPLRGGPLPLPQAGAGLFDRVVVAVDPPASVGGDACGIVVAGRRDGVIFVLADLTVEHRRPEQWARVVAGAAREWGASHVVAEGNQGGVMVESVLKAADAGLRVKVMHARHGKVARAEPVAVLFETGKACLAGVFPELEAELAGLTVGGAYQGPGRSPDRADACVWAVTELSATRSGVPRVVML